MSRSASSLALIAKIFAATRGAAVPSALMAEALKAPRDVVETMKAAVGAGSLSSEEWASNLAPYGGIVGAFVESLQSQSVFARLYADGLIHAPSRTPLSAFTVAAGGTIVSEAAPIPVTRMTMAENSMAPQKAAAIVVLSRVALRSRIAPRRPTSCSAIPTWS